ncbi:MAG: YifB family Mg chelatase-like AAA ATPase [Actinomycetota bacterium]
MYARIRSGVLFGARGHGVDVEVHVANGLPAFQIVGLPDTTVRESRDRVRAAIQSTGRKFPDVRVTVNLAPSEPRKSGSGLDVAIAVGVLVADGHIPPEAIAGLGFVGELGLDGSIRPVAGVAPIVGVLDDVDVVVPVGSEREAVVAASGRVRTVSHLVELIDTLGFDAPWPDHPPEHDAATLPSEPDLADVRGQRMPRLALELAAAGGHHLLFVGPPGSGKTMLASRLPGLLPSLERDAALDATMVHSAAGVALPPGGLVVRPPFRCPHHTSSQASIVGGGTHTLRPGEISIASGGVLFLDELPEFAPTVLDTLRQPLEAGVVHVARAAASTTLPARFQLVAAMNPCPCGSRGESPGACSCGADRAQRYVARVSGPLLDRFDLRVNVEPPEVEHIMSAEPGESTAVVAERVATARDLASFRQGCLNAFLPAPLLDDVAPLTTDARRDLRAELELGRLSGRGYHRVRRLARTVADVAGHDGAIGASHVSTALELRRALRPAQSVGRWLAA